MAKKTKYNILSGKDIHGTPAFFIPIYKGHIDTIKSYFEEILASNLESYRKERLLVESLIKSL